MADPRPPSRVVIHCGFHRTGTSTVQRCLRENKDLLAPRALVALRENLPRTARSAGIFARYPNTLTRWNFRALLRRELRDLPGANGRPLILSTERFSGLMPGRHSTQNYDAALTLASEVVRATRAVLGQDMPIALAYTVRQADEWLESVWRFLVRTDGLSVPYHAFCEQYQSLPDHRELIADIQALVEPAVVTAIPFVATTTERLGATAAILRLAGLEPDLIAELTDVSPANVGLSRAKADEMVGARQSGTSKAPKALSS